MINFLNFEELGIGDTFIHGNTKFKVDEGYFLERPYNAIDIVTGELYEFDSDDIVCHYEPVEMEMKSEVLV